MVAHTSNPGILGIEEGHLEIQGILTYMERLRLAWVEGKQRLLQATWVNLEENMASEINQPQKYKYYVINAYEIKAKLQKAHRMAIAKGWECLMAMVFHFYQ